MGIEGFSKFLADHAPSVYFEVPMDYFAGKRIAIDMNNLTFIMMTIAIKEVVDTTNLAREKPDQALINSKCLDRIMHRLEIFLYYKIIPVCVFDGKPHPLKDYGKKKRREASDKIKQKLSDAEQRLYGMDSLLRNTVMTQEYAKYLK